MHKVFSALLICTALLFMPTPALAVISGVQIPSEQPIKRLIPAKYGFKWLKYQYSLGSAQPLDVWIDTAKQNNFRILVSVAKNGLNIPTLGNPSQSGQYCPYDEELKQVKVGERQVEDEDGVSRSEDIMAKEKSPAGNGYMEFRDAMQQFSQKYGNKIDAIEVWNEPNLADEWSDQNLGPISPQNYANFLNCGVKGLKRASYNGKVISAALAPLSADYDDLKFLNEFVSAGGLDSVDAIGWHANIVKDIPPTDNNLEGFQRVKKALSFGKPVWITEYGWARQLAKITRAQQSDYINRAFALAPTLGKIEAMFIWNFGFSKENTDKSFEQWDIENEDESCNPNVKSFNDKYPNSKDVIAPSSQEHALIANTFTKNSFPQEINQDNQKAVTEVMAVKVDVRQGFFEQIQTFFAQFVKQCIPVPLFNISVGFCSQNLNFSNTVADQNNGGLVAAKIASDSTLIANSLRPQEIVPLPMPKDCNLDRQKTNTESVGDIVIDKTSQNLGTQNGFYSINTPDLDLTKCIEEVKQDQNLAIGKKVFNQDERFPDQYCRKKLFYQAENPEGIKPDLRPTVANP